jgi:hypothetical protein
MNKEETCLQALLQQKLLPLYYHDSGEKSVAILHALYDGGYASWNTPTAVVQRSKTLRY